MVDYEISDSELEALLLEARVIKEHQPPHNSFVKEGRKTWFVMIDLVDDFPRVKLTSEQLQDRTRYFGPFSSRRWTEEVIDALYRIYPIQTCEEKLIPDRDSRPCLNHYLKRCDAPCAARISRSSYRTIINDVEQLLAGDYKKVVRKLTVGRDRAAAEPRFERAAAIQKRIERTQDIFVFLDAHLKREREILYSEVIVHKRSI